MIKVSYHTLGCKVNQYETEKIREALEAVGCVTVPFSAPADACVLNTCSVTAVADGKSRYAIRKALRTSPEGFLVVAGCYAELEPGQIAEIEGVGLVVSNEEKEAIPERILAHFGVNALDSVSHPPRPRMRTRAVVKVQDGCDQFCSYCVIPYARSRKTSRSIPDVISELQTLAGFGYKEIVLTGIRLGSYNADGSRLPELIREAMEIDGIERIRLSSIELWEIDDALLDLMQHPKLCRHLHIPLQSGDDDTLQRMNRPYDCERYSEVISGIRTRVEGIGITTDVIVGFPGETDSEFENTFNFIEQIGFSRLHVFRYSPRERTKAAEMPEQVDVETKKLRAERLVELGRKGVHRFASSFIGKTVHVLAETHSGNLLHGFADNYIEVQFAGDAALKNRIVPVEIMGVGEDGIAIANYEF